MSASVDNNIDDEHDPAASVHNDDESATRNNYDDGSTAINNHHDDHNHNYDRTHDDYIDRAIDDIDHNDDNYSTWHHHHGNDGSTIIHDHSAPDHDDPYPGHEHDFTDPYDLYYDTAPVIIHYGPASHIHSDSGSAT